MLRQPNVLAQSVLLYWVYSVLPLPTRQFAGLENVLILLYR